MSRARTSPYRPAGRGGLATLAASAVLALAACGSPAAPAGVEQAAGEEAGIAVVTSTDVYGAVAEAVGGERVAVRSIITDPAADPHSYESTPADALAVSDAQVIVLNGGGYDAFMPQLVEASGSEAPVVDVAAISGIEGATETEEHGAHEGEEGHGHGHGEFNEHLWYSLPTMKLLATELAEAFAQLDAANAAVYTANAEAFQGEVDGLIERAEAVAAAHGGDRVVVTEPIAAYLIEAAGLTDATPPEFAEAVEEDTDPPAAVVQETLALFAGEPVRALILNSQTQTPTTDQVRQAAEAANVPVVEMSETLPEGQSDYPAWMGGQIDALAAALDRA
ncbi:MAG TPA: zinc ABC transporter substrate-binding protein [Pseudonocardia sp.]|nr:zinc ABC transporter substrate-binding protein [Pseudonocardia sp.]